VKAFEACNHYTTSCEKSKCSRNKDLMKYHDQVPPISISDGSDNDGTTFVSTPGKGVIDGDVGVVESADEALLPAFF
jgi:hypothetical protein